MACRADRMDWRDATSSFATAGPRWSCRGHQPSTTSASTDHTVLADTLLADILAPLSAALAPADAGTVSAGILDRLREHRYLPPAVPKASP